MGTVPPFQDHFEDALRTLGIERTAEAQELRANVAAAWHKISQAAEGVRLTLASPGLERLTDHERDTLRSEITAHAIRVAQRVADVALREVVAHAIVRAQAEIERDVAVAEAAKGKPR